uniref:CWF21 domain-containing protein n=1 Tax=Ditylenchus dipsaci TaxID=166011 RepID=A0A915CS74_9BILA
MYNGIGLTTARGTGTNGFVQANLSNLLFSKNRTDYNTEADIEKAEAEVNRKRMWSCWIMSIRGQWR